MATPTTATSQAAPPADGTNPDNKCVTVIFNPVSGQGDSEQRKVLITEALAQHGYRCQHLVTTPEQGARHFAEQALRDGVDLLAVSGGDGTVIEAMSAIIGTQVPIAIFPAGTGNLLSVNLALPRQVPDAVHAALFGARRSLDLARITVENVEDSEGGEQETKYFAILAGAGYDATVIRDADRETKNRLGIFAYLWAAVKNLRRRPVRVRIRIDDSPHRLRRRAKSVMVANMGRLQGGIDVIPEAAPDDGLLDVVILKAETLADWFGLLWSALRGRMGEDRSVETLQGKKVEVELSFPQPIQFDGEAGGLVRRFAVEIVPAAVQVMVPKDSPV